MIPIYHFEKVSSTMDVALNWVFQAPQPSNAIFLAQEQEMGRGQYGRRWESAKGNLFATLVYFPLDKECSIQQMSMIVGVAVHTALKRMLPDTLPLQLKWPNDILMNRAKVGGVLIQKDSVRNNPFWLVGIGVNVQHHPENPEYPATHLNHELNVCISLEDLIQNIFNDLCIYMDQLFIDGFSYIREIWMKNAFGLDGNVYVDWGEGDLKEALFFGVDRFGFPILQMKNEEQPRGLPRKIYWDQYHYLSEKGKVKS